MPDLRSSLGTRGERVTLDLYRQRGYTLVAANWRCSLGEIDLILRRRDVLVFCEVKTRRGSRRGAGFEAVDSRKQRKVRALAEVFLLTHSVGPVSVRFDVASVAIGRGQIPGASPQVELFEDAF